MMDIKKALALRKRIKSKKPDFVKQDYHKKPKLSASYRKPRGLQSKMRLQKVGYRRTPKAGYGSPSIVRNATKDGFKPFIVNNRNELERIDAEKESIIISKGVGMKNKIEIIKAALDKKIHIENIKDAKGFLEAFEEQMKKRKESKKKKASERTKKREKIEKEAEKKESVEEKVADEEEKKKVEKEEKDKIIQKKQ